MYLYTDPKCSSVPLRCNTQSFATFFEVQSTTSWPNSWSYSWVTLKLKSCILAFVTKMVKPDAAIRFAVNIRRHCFIFCSSISQRQNMLCSSNRFSSRAGGCLCCVHAASLFKKSAGATALMVKGPLKAAPFPCRRVVQKCAVFVLTSFLSWMTTSCVDDNVRHQHCSTSRTR